jgi:hypothetical protein
MINRTMTDSSTLSLSQAIEPLSGNRRLLHKAVAAGTVEYAEKLLDDDDDPPYVDCRAEVS